MFRTLTASLIASLAVVAAAPALAQSAAWPSKPIRLIVPTAAGSPLDTIGRAVAQKLQERLGQPFVVENKVGANQIIGMEACARSAPDGYTLCIASTSGFTSNPFLYQKLPYDPEKQLVPVALLVEPVAVVATNPQTGVKTFKDVVELSKRQPTMLNWGSMGIGSVSHFQLEALNEATAWKVTHVPYPNVAQLIPAALNNSVQLTYGTIGSIRPHADAGKLVPLMVLAPQRSRFMPTVPTAKELGLTDVTVPSWFGMVAPAGTPAEIVLKLNEMTNAIIHDAAFKASVLDPQTTEPLGGTLAEINAYLKRERAQTAALVKKANIKLD